LHLHPFYQKRYAYRPGDFPNAEDAYNRCISLPMFPDMSDLEVNRVINAIEKIVCAYHKRALALAS
jgi:perosamine synthetase